MSERNTHTLFYYYFDVIGAHIFLGTADKCPFGLKEGQEVDFKISQLSSMDSSSTPILTSVHKIKEEVTNFAARHVVCDIEFTNPDQKIELKIPKKCRPFICLVSYGLLGVDWDLPDSYYGAYDDDEDENEQDPQDPQDDAEQS